MATVTGVSHVAIKVDNLDAAVNFYSAGLGMELRHRVSDAALVAAPDGVILELFSGGQHVTNKSGFTHFCLNTFDADAAFTQALACGAVASRGEPYDLGELRIAFVTAPTGEEVEFWHIGAPVRPTQGRYVKGFVHAALTVPDMDACVRFYEGLGIKRKVGWGWGCSMRAADMRELELFTKGEMSANTSGITHVCFLTDDVDQTLACAIELGGTLSDAPNDWKNIRFAFFRGLAGELVELFQIVSGKAPDIFDPMPSTGIPIK